LQISQYRGYRTGGRDAYFLDPSHIGTVCFLTCQKSHAAEDRYQATQEKAIGTLNPAMPGNNKTRLE
jgi:hypothetical protein